MEYNKDNFSHIFKQKLEGYEKEPPAYLWANIQSQMDTTPQEKSIPLFFSNGRNVYYAIAFAAIIILLLYFLTSASDSGALHVNPLNQSSGISSTGIIEKENTISKTITNKILEEETDVKLRKVSNENNHTDINASHLAIQTPSSAQNKEDRGSVAFINTLKGFFNIESLSSTTSRELNVSERKSNYSEVYLAAMHQSEEGLWVINQPQQEQTSPKGKWSFGVFATPEMMFSGAQSFDNDPSLAADFSVMYQKNNYFIQSGFALEYANDYSNADVDYMTYDFVGSYQDVYDVTFDTTGGTPTPIYHTQQVDVIDTTESNQVTVYTNNYNYFNLPLMFGYRNQFSQRFGYTIKTGPIISFMMTESADYAFNQDGADIMGINNKPADRVSTNWQMMLGVGLNYKINNNISFALEPRVKYYFNPVYDGTQVKKSNPFAVGVQTGLIFGL